MRTHRLAWAFAALTLGVTTPAAATPGPDSVAVVANANVPESVALAQTYAAARDVPDAQVCLLDLPTEEDISLDDYETMFLEPLRACLDATPTVRERIESILLIRGVPMRVQVPFMGRTEAIGLAAALGLWDSADSLGIPILRQEAGTLAPCGGGNMCFAARWANPYRGFPFESGWTLDRDGIVWKPVLVTMLHARSYEDAEGLLDSALAAESMAPPTGEMLFMDGADPARGALDGQYPVVINNLTALGFTANRVPFDSDLTGHTLMSFATGTASLGMTIEGNTFLPGSVVDNLTSFGAVPANFREDGTEQQVSIARWVERGVAGVHGTVAEPLNNCFPGRIFVTSYASGATLAEAYHTALPYVFWMNLVLGDPMAAPYAIRPTLSVSGIDEGASLAGATSITVDATDAESRGIESVAMFVDGVEVARAMSGSLTHCLDADPGEHQLLIVARVAEDASGVSIWKPKGWVAYSFTAAAGASTCATPMGDGGVSADGGVSSTDAGPGAMTGDGCGCRVTTAPGGRPIALALIGIALGLRRRRSR
ncbi:MAG: TIGR03790 family protein [Sandaracinaceae bacterium]